MSTTDSPHGHASRRLEAMRTESLAPAGEEANEKQRARGKRTARERIDALVDPGSFVELEDESGETMTVEVSGVGGAGTVSPTSPLGSALLGHKLGESVNVKAPRGSWRATIRAIK